MAWYQFTPGGVMVHLTYTEAGFVSGLVGSQMEAIASAGATTEDERVKAEAQKFLDMLGPTAGMFEEMGKRLAKFNEMAAASAEAVQESADENPPDERG